MYLLALVLLLCHEARCQYNVERHDPFAMLSATLKTFQEAACDGQSLNLECPEGTTISIQHVQYGRSSDSSPKVRRESPGKFAMIDH